MLETNMSLLESVLYMDSSHSKLWEKCTSFLFLLLHHGYKDTQIGRQYEELNITNVSLRLYGKKPKILFYLVKCSYGFFHPEQQIKKDDSSGLHTELYNK